ncbi:GrpB family protein [Plantibacter sp. PA-3-X8]|uniref:GrpB family protein n=1 Tax=Plantibacter sp. PA-3-X8 TaxID=2480625 RepID=UPI001F152322|nr:GrpB family protein [Plantibacter sp. PA-3-X8]
MDDVDVEWFDQPIEEAVEIHDASDDWADMGRHWEDLLKDSLHPLPAHVDHVGSTAVPGLAAKPVIDMQIQVPDIEDEPAYLPALEELGMVLRARGANFRFLRPPAGRPRNVHIHVCGMGSVWAAEHLAFRDALREGILVWHASTSASNEDWRRPFQNARTTTAAKSRSSERLSRGTHLPDPTLDARRWASQRPVVGVPERNGDDLHVVLIGEAARHHRSELDPGDVVSIEECEIAASEREEIDRRLLEPRSCARVFETTR